MRRVLVFFAAIIGVAWPAAAGNFTSDVAELTAAAEAARVESARFWSGRELPGTWSRPCPIRWTDRDATHHGGGATTFSFDHGDVFGWRMTVSGNWNVVRSDVVPHEVDHAVRATLVRRPITRWVDEGSAQVMESEESHERYRKLTAQFLANPAVFNRFDQADYPADPTEMANVYATGFSVCEFLAGKAGPARLLEFQQDPRAPSAKLREFYGCDPATLRREWTAWFQARAAGGCGCGCFNCPRHGSIPREISPPQADRPTLVIFCQPSCPGCVLADADAQAGRFSRFSLVKVTRSEATGWKWSDPDRYRRFAAATGYDSSTQGELKAPTFWIEGTSHYVTGYSEQRREGILKALVATLDEALWSGPKPRQVPASLPPPLAPDPRPADAGVRSELEAIRAELQQLKSNIADGRIRGPPGPAGPVGPPGPEGIPGRDAAAEQAPLLQQFRRELDGLKATRIPVQIVDEKNRVLMQQSVPLGKPIRLRVRPEAR